MSKVNENRPGYKKTKLGWIPKDWEISQIGELCKIRIGRDLDEKIFNKHYSKEYSYPVYSNTVDNKGLYGFYKKAEYSEKSLTVVGRGIGVGTSFHRNHSYGAIGRLIVLMPENKVHNVFLSEQINYRVRFFVESSGIPQLTGIQISKYKILLPPLPEQKKIAEILSTWDNAIEKLEKLIELKEQRKKGLMQQLLTGKKRLPGFGKPVEKEGEVPEGWKVYKLNNIGYTYNGLSGKNKNDFGAIGYPYITYMEVFKNYQIITCQNNYVSVNQNEKQNEVVYGDIIFTTSSETPDEVGMSAVYTGSQNNLYLNSFCFGFRQKEPKVLDSIFASYYFRGAFREKLYKLAQGATRYNLSKKSFLKEEVIIPGMTEQQAIGNVLLVAASSIDRLYSLKQLVKEQKKGLMQKLLTGEVRVKTEQQETADVR